MTRSGRVVAIALWLVSIAMSAHATSPGLPEVSLSPDGIILRYPKWNERGGWGPNVGLTLTTIWEGERQTIKAIDAGTTWQVSLRGRPRPDTKVRLEASYHFSVDETARTTLHQHARAFIKAAIEVMRVAFKVGSPGDPDTAESYHETFRKAWAKEGQLKKAALLLDEYHTREGVSATRLIAEKVLKFVSKEDLGWVPKVGPNGEIEGDWGAVQASLSAEADWSATIRELEDNTTLSGECAAAFEVAKNEGTEDKLREVMPKCKVECGKDVTDQCKAISALSIDPKEADSISAWREKANALPPAEAAQKAQATAQLWAAAKLHVLHEEAPLRKREDEAFKAAAELFRSETLVGETLGKSLLTAHPGHRPYDVTTGFVYAPRLNTISTPILVSICPDGCGDRSFAIDLGVRAGTVLGSDPRDDGMAFMVGGSVNLFAFLRVAGGTMILEDLGRGKPLTWDAYFGFTFDLVTAAELLGVVGFRVPKAPTVEEL